MRTACLLVCFALIGCDSAKPTEPDKKEPPKKSGSGPSPAQEKKSEKKVEKKSNPLVGRWRMKKAGTQDWSPTVSKNAVIEFLGDGATPNTGSLIVTDRDVTGKGFYDVGKDGFFFEVKFRRKDDSPAGGYSGSFDATKMTEQEIVGDLFTLERVK